ncbi:2-succinyl-5-enolpyruvyl-6-hydroxy-3-cyclohexene-1-carboxylic-acid synthase [Shewanella intestini]|uniref:2-succinyl-5-enolpyruvyl-6-hydroxy-3-cyclohexene-1-carboxylate synthase n=1 Tax=Shewanella intestini TaxID=2017544 RepID=A0ABS5I3Y7_9GAMM|nr:MULTISPECIES: 2-succinyl-5-enolpyruvyl-6-hydroxy-3-cyclohexene-1-carboxylic-acid synthase [Shewanella]MBR9728738.1 2-succinyl-5-enolpyruvyl-6-hydroxy-3-cyclohexene-1-carboxylic-acid synthase [Shewanella intestini]MRG36814.1 2-succinyl-5-enolpyruvyl-6-hydroxy-3-cyclohexene-1-carboxylic-acid synthase [Shewanella sp. XMDDZSB0408]
MTQHSIADINLLWGQLILEELHRLGVKHICLSPGSRSSPLTLAAASQTHLSTHTHFDERGLGFMALGLAKSSHAPVAIVTTSGTAVANLYPAIIEAWLTHVPLIVLSGDRPMELIDCGANQAITQTGIFAQYAKQINLPTPDYAFPAAALLTCLDEAIEQQTQPIHINCMYREPLYPSNVVPLAEQQQISAMRYLAPLASWMQHSQPYNIYHSQPSNSLPCEATLRRFVHGKGVIVVGTLADSDQPQEIITLAKTLGWPVLVDAQSQLRQHPDAIGNIDQLLHHKSSSKLLEQADRLLVFGGRFISKRLIEFMNQPWHSYWQVLTHSARLDPSHQVKQVWLSSVSAFCQANWHRSSQALWAESLSINHHKLNRLFEQRIDNNDFGEAQVMRQITRSYVGEQQLFIGNSLPIRLYDMFAPATTQSPTVYTNRGASGIDGLMATATGVAKGNQRPTTMVVGDISCLHDLNSFALLKQLETPFVLVIFNNDGGNIFNLLPVPNETLRSDFYRLSHGLEFGYGAAMFGLAYRQVDDIADFKQVYQEAFEFNCASIIEVTVTANQASDQIAELANWVKQDL